MSITVTRGSFPSCDKIHTIPYYIATPDGCAPKGIIQIVHGMAEQSERYLVSGTVNALAEGGYIVCANDHIGHGGAVKDESEYGDVASLDLVLNDLRTLRGILRARYRYLPYFFLGHSMGSFLARALVLRHPDDLDGVILTGTSGGGEPSKSGKRVASLLCLLGLGKKKGNLFYNMTEKSYNRGITDGKWVVSDPEVLAEYQRRPDCGFPFTNRGYLSLFRLLNYINDEEVIATTPRSVPTLLLSGEKDPVGRMGEGVKHYHSLLFDAGVDDLRMKLYPDVRHEIMNEPACKEQVWADILAWCDEECEHYRAERTMQSFGGFV